MLEWSSLVDTHCHLDLGQFDPDRDEVVARAVDAGVTRIIVPAVDLASNARVVELAERYPQVFAAVGIHPNDIPTDKNLAETLAHLAELAQHPRVVAIGEIGLDYYWNKTPIDVQQEWLIRQLELAGELALPVIIHNRESTTDILRLLRTWLESGLPAKLAGRPGVLHSFSAGADEASIATGYGMYIGFTGPLTFKSADKLRQVALHAELERILVETDAPFLAPHPHRGQRNEPAYVRLVLDKLADVRGLDNRAMAEQTTTNAVRLFNLPEQ